MSQALGAIIEWSPESKKITVKKAGVELHMTLDSPLATVNGKSIELPAPVKAKNGAAIAPVRFLAENLGYKVEWLQGLVSINSSGSGSINLLQNQYE